MASKEVYATRAFRYGTRMLVAGDPVIMTGPDVRLYRALGKISEDAPKGHLHRDIADRTAVAPTPKPKAPAKKAAPKAKTARKAPAKRTKKAAVK